MRKKALEWLYREMKRAKIALARAEGRPHVLMIDLENIHRKIDVLDYLTTLVNKEPVEEE